MVWNTENEDGSMVRLVNQPHLIALKVVGFEDKTISDTLGFPTSKRELFDKLQMKLEVFSDGIEVNGLFPIQPVDIQSLASIKGDKRGILYLIPEASRRALWSALPGPAPAPC
jgi:hypothetical protein